MQNWSCSADNKEFKIGQPYGLTLRFLLAGDTPDPKSQNQEPNQRPNQEQIKIKINSLALCEMWQISKAVAFQISHTHAPRHGHNLFNSR